MKQFVISSAVATAAFLTACQNSESTNSGKQSDSVLTKNKNPKLISHTKYTCTMHPEVISDTAGHCPKCGMELVPIKDSASK
jgi:hypothetical protein